MIDTTLPPGPPKRNLFQVMKALSNPIPLFQECRRIYGKTFTLRNLWRSATVFISDPIDLKQVFSATPEQLNAGELNATLLKTIVGDYSLLTLDGKKHLQHKKLLLPSFHGQRMKGYGEMMIEISKRKISNWNQGNTLQLLDEARDITFRIILSAIFGMDEENTRFNTLTKLLHDLLRESSKSFAFLTLLTPFLHRNLWFLTPWSKIIKLRQNVNDCLLEEIAGRKKMSLDSRIDTLSILLQTRDEAGNIMSDHEIRDEMLTLLEAGHETVAISVAWTIYWVLSNPDTLKKLKDELNQFVYNNDDLLSNLDKLVYLDAVIKEVLRITAVVPHVGRITNDTYTLGKYILPKGTIIFPCIYLTHNDPDSWIEPEKFMPERFLNSLDEPYTYLPFGSGVRRCIGAAFAQYEIKIIIAQILLNVELKLKENYIAKPKRKGPVCVPSGGVPVVVQKGCD